MTAEELLKSHVKDEYQLLHAKMVASVLRAYAQKFGENENLWYETGLLHDIDYFEYPDKHPFKAIEWLENADYPDEMLHAIKAHYHQKTGIEPQTKLAACLCATDELCGFLHAYSLMRPEGYKGMESKSVLKKFKDTAFARKIDRGDIRYGVEKFDVDFLEHIDFCVKVLAEL